MDLAIRGQKRVDEGKVKVPENHAVGRDVQVYLLRFSRRGGLPRFTEVCRWMGVNGRGGDEVGVD